MAGPLTEKQTHYLTRVRSNTQHLAGLINDLLDLSKIESGKIEVKSSRVSLGGLVHEVVEALRPVAAEKVIALEATIREPSILVWADRDKINQVLMNLVGNAIKFTPVQGRVTVSASRNGGESVQVSVSDTGPGIPPDEREKIFAKFYRIAEVNGDEVQRHRPRSCDLQSAGGVARRKDLGGVRAGSRQHVLVYVAVIGATEFTVVLMRIAFSILTLIRHSFGNNNSTETRAARPETLSGS